MNDLAKNLQHNRKSAGLTQEALAQKIGVTRQAVSSWERGNTEPDISTLELLADTFTIDINALISGKTTTSPYAKFQKRCVLYAICTGAVAVLVFLLQIMLYPYLRTITNSNGSTFSLFLYERIVPTIGCFSLGVFFIAFLSLFYKVYVYGCWKKLILVFGIFTILPALLVILDCILCSIFQNYIPHFIYALYLSTILHPPLHSFLFKILPTCSGALCFLGFLKI